MSLLRAALRLNPRSGRHRRMRFGHRAQRAAGTGVALGQSQSGAFRACRARRQSPSRLPRPSPARLSPEFRRGASRLRPLSRWRCRPAL